MKRLADRWRACGSGADSGSPAEGFARRAGGFAIPNQVA